MICPYNNFKEMDCDKCGAKMWIKNPSRSGYLMMVCAIAYNGGEAPRHKEEKNG